MLLRPQACQLPLFSYIVERLCACCYEQAWYAKLGGVVSIKFLMERLPLIWVLQNQLTFLKALLFVMMDLTGEVRLCNLGFSKKFIFCIDFASILFPLPLAAGEA